MRSDTPWEADWEDEACWACAPPRWAGGHCIPHQGSQTLAEGAVRCQCPDLISLGRTMSAALLFPSRRSPACGCMAVEHKFSTSHVPICKTQRAAVSLPETCCCEDQMRRYTKLEKKCVSESSLFQHVYNSPGETYFLPRLRMHLFVISTTSRMMILMMLCL